MGRFNEAAGFTRRKPEQTRHQLDLRDLHASMRPPDLPGGNQEHSRKMNELVVARLQ